MRALSKTVVDVIWAAIEPLLPRPPDGHPLGCHRPRISGRLCLQGIIWRLVTGCSWVSVEYLLDGGVSDTTLRRRRDEWVAAGVFEQIAAEAIAAWGRIMGLRLRDVCIDGSVHKAPCGGPGTGKSPVDRRKSGWKWSLAVDAEGVPVAWCADGANRNDIVLFDPAVAEICRRGLHHDIDTLHLDRGYWGARVDNAAAAAGITDLARPPNGHPPPTAPNRRSRRRWGCAGASSEPTHGCRTTGSCDETPTGDPSTEQPSSPSPPPSSSPSNSPTTNTAGTPTDPPIRSRSS